MSPHARRAPTVGNPHQHEDRVHVRLLRAWLSARNPEVRARLGRLLELRRDPREKPVRTWTVADDFRLAEARGRLAASRMGGPPR